VQIIPLLFPWVPPAQLGSNHSRGPSCGSVTLMYLLPEEALAQL
jgi:hypothetical protein